MVLVAEPQPSLAVLLLTPRKLMRFFLVRRAWCRGVNEDCFVSCGQRVQASGTYGWKVEGQ